jgi:hypothetical protein
MLLYRIASIVSVKIYLKQISHGILVSPVADSNT